MTEKEAIKVIKGLVFCGMCTTGPCDQCERRLAKDAALAALEEIQQYRETGTAEEFREVVERQEQKSPIDDTEFGMCPLELPELRNNDQRKAWLRSYKDWGLWYRDGNIGAEYYKYDFANGARLVAEVYHEEATEYHDARESCFLHLAGGPEPPKGQYGEGKWAWHKKYVKHPNSETELVEFLKEVQRNG